MNELMRQACSCFTILIGLAVICYADSSWTSSEGDSAEQCLHLAEEFSREHGQHPSSSPNIDEMLFFLHIPRTAGRSFHFCFLKQAYPPSRRCLKSYDILRLNESFTGCGLLSSHDDYSIIDRLPQHAAIFTQLRDPVERVLSAYEFALEVAARSLPTSTNKVIKPSEEHKTTTRSVWPWSFLVPFLEEDLARRLPLVRQAAGKLSGSKAKKSQVDPYDSNVAMPLSEFLKQPGVENTLFNGATLQVLGLTDYSQWEGAEKLRSCLPSSPSARELLQQLAEKRLENFVHVGLAERLEESLSSLAGVLGLDLNAPCWSNSLDPTVLKNKSPEWMRNRTSYLQETEMQLQKELQKESATQQALSGPPDRAMRKLIRARKQLAATQQELALLHEQLFDQDFQWQEDWDKAYENFYALWRGYHYCVDAARARNSKRRASSFKKLDVDGKQTKFSSKERQELKQRRPDLIDFIRSKNDMDLALYAKAEELLSKAVSDQKERGIYQPLPPMSEANLSEIGRFERAMKLNDSQSKPEHMRRPQGAEGVPIGSLLDHDELR